MPRFRLPNFAARTPFANSTHPLLNAGLPGILIAVLIWGTMPFLIAAALRGLSPAQLVASRMLIAGGIMTVVTGPRTLWEALRSHLFFFLVLALVGFTLPNLFYTIAMQSVPIPVLSFIANSYPALAMALAVLFLKERPTPLHLAGIVCVLVGLYLMAGVEPGQTLAPGVVLVLLASFGWAASSIAGKKLTADLAPTVIVAGRHVVAGVLALPLLWTSVGASASGEGAGATVAGWDAWAALLALVVMSLVSMMLYYGGLRHTTVATASLLEAFAPVITLALSVLWFGQGLHGRQLVAAALVLTGSVLVTMRMHAGRFIPRPPPNSADAGP